MVANYIGGTLLRGKESESLTPTVNLYTGGLVDSIGAMRLVSWIESTYALKIPLSADTINYALMDTKIYAPG